jgi:Kef-type K+ transport system membrane component KefB
MASRRTRALQYLLLVGAPLGMLGLVLAWGAGLPIVDAASLAAVPRPADAADGLRLELLVAQLLVVLLAARVGGLVSRRLGQPGVIGEMLAGILLGPSILGAWLPTAHATLFPADSLGPLNALSQLGVLLFLFLVGVQLELHTLRRHAGTALLASHASIAAPFVLGSMLAIWLYPRFAPSGVPFAPFALFLGAAMSVTAFPVLARILEERKLTNTTLGTLAIASAAVDDVSAWTLLAIVVALTREGMGVALVFTVVGSALYVVVMLRLLRPWLARALPRLAPGARVPGGTLLLVLVLFLGSALVTDQLGIHALFGAFFAGTILPREGGVPQALVRQFGGPVGVVLLPLVFAYSGLRTHIDLLDAGDGWLVTAAIVAVAIVGKLGGTALAARIAGSGWREATALGVLMNTRGLMALVILNMGLDLGVLSPALFAMMVVMALVTTVMTAPLLSLLQPATTPDIAPVEDP